jgi:transcriptional regulator with GAF, ATPase, and Fis domain
MSDDGGSGGRRRDLQLAKAFAEIARALVVADTLEATLDMIAHLAVDTIDGCEHAGVFLIESGTISTPAASDDIPRALDTLQYELEEGPCLDAMREHEVFRIEDLWMETRWPRFTSRTVKDTGVRSLLAFRLFAERETLGALNLYAKRTGAFDQEADELGAVFAAHAAVAMVGARQSEQKDEAIRTRDVIGQAKGILMAQQGVSENEAFDILRRASQRMNVKLRDIAEQIAERPRGT